MMKYIKHNKIIRPIIYQLIAILCLHMVSPALAQGKPLLITNESWTEHVVLNGSPGRPVIISPLARLDLSAKTEKIVVVPEELKIQDEIREFRMFRNRYVIFGIYLSLALYYNWLTRHR
jgi:hypothetical protein